MDFKTYRVKLKTVQPQIMCSGRDFIECHYRGKVINEDAKSKLIEFKYKGEIIREYYYEGLGFHKLGLEDIKIVE